MNRRRLATLASGHLAVDSCQGAVPALLPFLIAQRGISVGQAALLVLAATLASSIVQPVFGILSDRRPMPWLMPLGLVLAGTGIAAVGLLPGYTATFAAITVSGVGVAAFHPEGSRAAKLSSGDRPATAMSLFSVGGNAGFAIGPLTVTGLVLAFGLHGTLGLLVLPALAAVLVTRAAPSAAHTAAAQRAHAASGEDRWRPFAVLAAAIMARSVVYFGLMTFVPLYFIGELGTSKGLANAALTVMLAAGALGTLLGGRLGDRIGPRVVFAGSMVAVPPLVAGVLLTHSPAVAIVLLAFVGAATIATFSTTVVIGQALLPKHLGVASGVTLGMSIGVGGVAASLLGVLADHQGVRAVLEVIAFFPLIALALATRLPKIAAAGPASGAGDGDAQLAAIDGRVDPRAVAVVGD